jgi:uncharacterized RDD family membrane protein YckC
MQQQPNTPFYAYPPPNWQPPVAPPPMWWVPPYMLPWSVPAYEYASFWRRLVASWLDSLILGIPLLIVSVMVSAATGFETETVPPGVYLVNLAIFVVPVAYHVVGTRRGGTPGYQALGLQVTNAAGQQPSLRQACLRQIFLIASMVVQVVYLIIGMASADTETITPRMLIAVFGGGAIVGLISLIYTLGCLMVIWDDHKQALHDKIAGTYAIRKRS